MRVLFATYSYAPAIGGVERQTERLAHALVARGHEVHIITAQRDGAPEYEVDAGIAITRVAAGSGGSYRRMATYIAALGVAAIRLRDRFDVMHVQQALYPAAAMAVLARSLRKPIIVRNSGSGMHGAVQLMSSLPLGRTGLRLIARFATTVSLSNEMTTELRGAGFTEVVQIPNGVSAGTDVARKDARRILGIADEAQVVLCVGRLDREKGTALLARAWPDVTSAQLLIAGDGPERHLLADLPRVRCDGMVQDLAPYYAAADVFVLPSESEGISNALLEAMAAGLPVVATSVGGNREVISSPELGVLVQPDDPVALARALQRVLANPGELGKHAREHVMRFWSFEAMVDAYERLYDRLLVGPH